MSRLNINNLTNENEDGSPRISGISTFSSPHYFVPPSGSTAQRPSSPGEGMIRFNTDSGHLEYYTGELWVDVIVNNYQIGISTNPAGTSGGLGTRALIIGGQAGAGNDLARVEYITISTLGNAQTFGNTSSTRAQGASCSSRTRGYLMGGLVSPTTYSNVIDSHEFSSTGDFIDFGDLTVNRRLNSGLSNSTRGISIGGQGGSPVAVQDVIDYITLQTTGTAQNFGSLRLGADLFGAALASSTRGIYADGTATNGTLDYITISTTGTSIFFGDLATNRGTYINSAANSTRGICAGGYTNPGTGSNSNIIEFLTIATLGNAQDFGDLTRTTAEVNGGAASPTRAIFAGGGPSTSNIIDYITIATTGDAQDFGDLQTASSHNSACSNGHGGL